MPKFKKTPEERAALKAQKLAAGQWPWRLLLRRVSAFKWARIWCSFSWRSCAAWPHFAVAAAKPKPKPVARAGDSSARQALLDARLEALDSDVPADIGDDVLYGGVSFAAQFVAGGDQVRSLTHAQSRDEGTAGSMAHLQITQGHHLAIYWCSCCRVMG